MGAANALVPFALIAYLVLTLGAFSIYPPRRVALVALIGGWMFLPHFDWRYRLLMMFTKEMFVPAAILLGSAIFDGARWRQLRVRAFDGVVLLIVVVPFLTSMSNDLGANEGAAVTWEGLFMWGGPYLIARLYLGDRRGIEALAKGLALGALVYVPFCLWESRMSPQLHIAVYGFRAWTFEQSYRMGGYRPSVFMQHGLALGMFMTAGTLCAYWLWRTRAWTSIRSLRFHWVVALLLVTTVLTRSTGAIMLLVTGIGVLEATRLSRAGWLIVALAIIPPLYCTSRILGWNAEAIAQLTREHLGEERAGSLQFRIHSEQRLVARAEERFLLGWGRFGRSLGYDEEGHLAEIPDSMWIIVLGINGVVFLILLGVFLLVPPMLLLRAAPPRAWADPRLAPAAALAVAILLWAIDDLANDMRSPLFLVIPGAILTFVETLRRRRARGRRRPRPADQGVLASGAPGTSSGNGMP